MPKQTKLPATHGFVEETEIAAKWITRRKGSHLMPEGSAKWLVSAALAPVSLRANQFRCPPSHDAEQAWQEHQSARKREWEKLSKSSGGKLTAEILQFLATPDPGYDVDRSVKLAKLFEQHPEEAPSLWLFARNEAMRILSTQQGRARTTARWMHFKAALVGKQPPTAGEIALEVKRRHGLACSTSVVEDAIKKERASYSGKKARKIPNR